jgi:regulator of cell morphogenesis and NO signaling
MTIEKSATIGEIARELPSAARFFEKAGLDYCCGGNLSLEEACRVNGLDVTTVIASLETIQDLENLSGSKQNWNAETLSNLVRHIVDKHHAVVRQELPRMVMLINKMCEAHGEKRPEFLEVQKLIAELKAELDAHLQKEEAVLFPYVQQLEQSLEHSAPVPDSCFGTVRNPIAMMEQEHENAGAMLSTIRGHLTDRTGCPTCLEFFQTFDNFEADLHQHIHLENNILFPRTIELEAAAAGR